MLESSFPDVPGFAYRESRVASWLLGIILALKSAIALETPGGAVGWVMLALIVATLLLALRRDPSPAEIR